MKSFFPGKTEGVKTQASALDTDYVQNVQT